MVEKHEIYCDSRKIVGCNCNCLYGDTVNRNYIQEKTKFLREELKYWEKRLKVLTRLENRL